jgi:hypothetical protein
MLEQLHCNILNFDNGSWNGLANMGVCRNPNLGNMTKVRACKGASQEWAEESHFMLPGVQERVREWTPTLPSDLPLWELESQWTFKFSEGNFRSQNSLDWNIFYIIGKLLELKCLKWVRVTHLGTYNIRKAKRKGRKSNCQFDSWPLKVRNRPEFLACRWRVAHP